MAQRDEREWQDFLKLADQLPFVRTIRSEVAWLGKVIYKRRPMALACVGGTASMQSAVLTDLVGAPLSSMAMDGDAAVWVDAVGDASRFSYLLTRAEEKPAHPSASTPAAHLVVRGPRREADVVLWLLPADGEVRDHYRRFAPFFVRGEGTSSANAAGDPLLSALPTVVVLTERRSGDVRAALGELGGAEVVVLDGVAFRDDGSVRWSSTASPTSVANALVDALPASAALEGARALGPGHAARLRLARRIVTSSASLSMTVGLAPIPFSDLAAIAPLQLTMVTAIAHLAGEPWDRKAAGQWLMGAGVVGGAALGFRWTARQLLKFVPGAGSLVSASMAGAGTASLGRAAIAYYLAKETAQGRRDEVREHA